MIEIPNKSLCLTIKKHYPKDSNKYGLSFTAVFMTFIYPMPNNEGVDIELDFSDVEDIEFMGRKQGGDRDKYRNFQSAFQTITGENFDKYIDNIVNGEEESYIKKYLSDKYKDIVYKL